MKKLIKKIKNYPWHRFGAFWYSEKADNHHKELSEIFIFDPWHRYVKNYCKPFFGKETRYNEWVPRFPFIHTGKFDDYKFVGFGLYTKSE